MEALLFSNPQINRTATDWPTHRGIRSQSIQVSLVKTNDFQDVTWLEFLSLHQAYKWSCKNNEVQQNWYKQSVYSQLKRMCTDTKGHGDLLFTQVKPQRFI